MIEVDYILIIARDFDLLNAEKMLRKVCSIDYCNGKLD